MRVHALPEPVALETSYTPFGSEPFPYRGLRRQHNSARWTIPSNTSPQRTSHLISKSSQSWQKRPQTVLSRGENCSSVKQPEDNFGNIFSALLGHTKAFSQFGEELRANFPAPYSSRGPECALWVVDHARLYITAMRGSLSEIVNCISLAKA